MLFIAIWLLIGLVIMIGVIHHVNTWEKRNPKPTSWDKMMHEWDLEIFHNKVMQLIIVLLGPITIFIAILNALTKNKGGGNHDV